MWYGQAAVEQLGLVHQTHTYGNSFTETVMNIGEKSAAGKMSHLVPFTTRHCGPDGRTNHLHTHCAVDHSCLTVTNICGMSCAHICYRDSGCNKTLYESAAIRNG
jgi:hypothetical protein